jgi:trans-aconitate methyltransferase
MADRWPAAQARGLELSPGAAQAARRRGLSVDVGGFDALTGRHDLVYAVAVLEHLPSPRAFFARAAAALSDHGVLVVTQPAQDRPSSDVFFVDHLWPRPPASCRRRSCPTQRCRRSRCTRSGAAP